MLTWEAFLRALQSLAMATEMRCQVAFSAPRCRRPAWSADSIWRAVVLGLAPGGLHPTRLLHPVQRREQGARLDLERALVICSMRRAIARPCFWSSSSVLRISRSRCPCSRLVWLGGHGSFPIGPL